ncbi:TldD/PmbA family protein [Fluviispira sanaruensis]|uniref:TldD/PmbA family protein n=2 Tax=Fluviispira sanaruensis TaxID=2493639 RepID=A0A4P2VI78_FLUSA|nr:TldD/PmbA family protein [Fluviispira sanaruensis]BBH52098.1 TldD/PmbA family protein [Fluviispira sanaruensis]
MRNALSMDNISQKNHIMHAASFDNTWREPLSILLGIGRAAGADFIEFFLQRGNYLSALIENGQVTAINPALSLGAGVRVFKGKEDCYVSTNDLSFKGLKIILEKALNIHALNLEHNRIIPEINLEPLRDYVEIKEKSNWLAQCSSVRELCDSLMQMNLAQQKSTKHLQSATTNGFRDWQEVLVASSEGIFARDIRLNQSLSTQVFCEDGAHRTSSHIRSGDAANPNFFRKINTQEISEKLAESSGHMLHADFISSGNYPVILANQFGGVIFHEACGHLLETTAIQRNSTPFLDKKGEKIAHENLTAWDEGSWENGFGSIDMDDEGMPAQKTLLIENGILRNFLCDRAGHLLTGHPRTGSGRRQNYTFAPASRMRNTYIAHGNYSKEDMFSSIDKGIYCKKLGGGSVGSTGDFNFAVEEAWLIENGKVTKPVKGATLIGQAPEVMQRISMSGNDLEISAGFCGSVSGSVYVTVGQPHIKVDSITVGGR